MRYNAARDARGPEKLEAMLGALRVLGIVYRRQVRYEEAITESEKAVELWKRAS